MPKKIAPPAEPETKPSESSPSAEPEIEEPQELTLDERMAKLEQAMPVIEQNFATLNDSINKVAIVIERLVNPQQFPAATNQPQQGGIDINQILAMAGQVMGSGSGDTKLQELAMKSLEADISLSHTLKNAVTTRILTPVAQDISEAVTGK